MNASQRLLSFLRPYWHWSLLAPLLMVLEVAMDLLQPHFVQQIIDEGVANRDLGFVLQTSGWMVAAAIIGMLGGVGCTVFAVLAAQNFGADLRSTLFRKVQSLSFGNLDRLETGGLITRLTNDVTQVQEVVLMMLRIMVRVPLLLIGSVIMAVITSPQLSFLFAILIPIVTVAITLIIRTTFPMFGEVQRRLDALNTVLQENLAGVRVVKAFARSAFEINRFANANARLSEQNTLAVRTSAITMPIMMLALNGGIVAALWIGGKQIEAGTMQVGQVVAFINYLTQALLSLMMVSMLIVRVSRAGASSERIVEVLDSQPDIASPSAGISLTKPQGRLAFDHVTFRYFGGDEPVLRDISFQAEPGQTVAILGATGAGKSSLINLIPRFYDVADGRILLDDVDVRTINETSLRRSIGVALQESILFSGTIRDNIRYGRPDASDEEVREAAHMAQADDFITKLPDGYDSIVGQRGVNLSGGQKQRIAIARALLNRPAVLVLDDSTSAVDVETEARIQQALDRLGQTRVIVAQRISSVLGADTILVLDDGRIVAEGTHSELLASSPIYREIYQSQIDTGAVSHGGN